MTPFEKAVSLSARDNLNYYLSNCCIVSECAFGEYNMRWGIFWKPLNFGLEYSQTINACARLHNLIVTRRDNLDVPGKAGSRNSAEANNEMDSFGEAFLN
jgi:hypothetical protein